MISIEDVPEFGTEWAADLRQFLRPFRLMPIFLRARDMWARNQGYAIVGQEMPDGSIHSTVWHDGELVHDPSPRPLSRPEYPIRLVTLLRALA